MTEQICFVKGRLTKALKEWLEEGHDDSTRRKLIVEQRDHEVICVRRADREPLSEAELREIRAIMAAHRAEPLQAKK